MLAVAACKGGGGGAAPTPSDRAVTSASAATSSDAPASLQGVALRVPMIHVPLKLDGELKEPPWNAVSARTRGFTDPASGGEARPYSEARFLWDADNLYVALYASDDNIMASVTQHDGPVWIDDAFSVLLTPVKTGEAPASVPTYSFDISAAGIVTDVKRVPGAKDEVVWESGIKLGVDYDGTLNKPTDIDEEWVIEAAIPLKPMGLEAKPGARFYVALSRCDTPRNTKQKRCGSWGTTSAPRLLELGP